MAIVTSKKQAHIAAAGGFNPVFVTEKSRVGFAIIGTQCAEFWFANYTCKDGKIGYTSQNVAVQIAV